MHQPFVNPQPFTTDMSSAPVERSVQQSMPTEQPVQSTSQVDRALNTNCSPYEDPFGPFGAPPGSTYYVNHSIRSTTLHRPAPSSRVSNQVQSVQFNVARDHNSWHIYLLMKSSAALIKRGEILNDLYLVSPKHPWLSYPLGMH